MAEQTRDTLEHAVVIGGSMAGLVTAAVLSAHAERVTIIEGDAAQADEPRHRSVAQASHTHVLQPRGLRVLESVYPGLAASLRDAGAVVLDDLSQMSFCALGRRFAHQPQPRAMTLLVTRRLLEREVRARTLALPRVDLRAHARVVGLAPGRPGRPGTRVTGAVVADAERAATSTVDADLLVDASGRASNLDRWLLDLGHPVAPPREEPVGVRYVSQPLLLPDDAVPEHLVVVGPQPGRRLGFYLPRYEGGLRVCTVMGYGPLGPSPDPDGIRTVTEQLAPPHVVDALRGAESVGAVTTYRFPASRRRTRLDRLPDGLLVLGDSLCSFNPIYGQGMTVAACQAAALGASLASGTRGWARRYNRAAERIADQAWEVSVPADHAICGRPQSRRERVEQRYLGRLLDRAQHDPATAVAVLEVLTMSRPKTSLMRPAMVRKACAPTTAARPGRRAAQVG